MKRLLLVMSSAIVVAVVLVASVSFASGSLGAPRVATLTGAAEVPPADPDGTGFAEIRLNHPKARVCWEVSWSNIEEPFAGHIHVGPAGVNGPIVVPLSPIASGCTTADQRLIRDIVKNPEQYYVNLHNTPYPGGAIRGQLSRP
jgi:hypothetical protein